MKAVVYYGPGDIRVEERPEPQAHEDNLVLAVVCCAVCGTDLKLGTIGNPRCHPPRIIGHEMVGTVLHRGTAVKDFAVGDRVTLATTVSCGRCYFCRSKRGNVCPNAKPISYDFDGAFAEYLSVPRVAIEGGNVIKVPESVADEAAALSEPLSCAINAQDLAGVGEGDAVLVWGGGPLGALHAELAKARGASDVIIVGNSEPRLSLLRKLAGICVVDGRNSDVSAFIRDRTDGLGVDVAVICAPLREAHEEVVDYVRKGGAVSLFASLPRHDSAITLDSRLIHYGELKLVGASDSRPEHVAAAVRLLAEGRLRADALITHRLPLECVHDALRLMQERSCLKVLLYPKGLST